MSKKSKKYRKENYGPSPILIWIMVIILLVGLFFLLNSSLFSISEITVVGTYRFSQQDVINASGLDYEANIFHVDEEAVRQGIEAIPYFQVEDIQRTFPTGVKIFVKEREPMAQIGTINGYYIVDENCTCLALIGVKDETLVNVVGLNLMTPEYGKSIHSDDEEKVKGLTTVLRAIKEYGIMGNITSVNLENLDSVEIDYLGSKVIIGKASTANDRLSVIEATYNAVKDKLTDGKVLNMEAQGGFYIG